MNKNCKVMSWQYYIRPAWKVPPVQAETKAKRMQNGANTQLRFGVLAFDGSHVPAALLCVVYSCHARARCTCEMNCSILSNSIGEFFGY